MHRPARALVSLAAGAVAVALFAATSQDPAVDGIELDAQQVEVRVELDAEGGTGGLLWLTVDGVVAEFDDDGERVAIDLWTYTLSVRAHHPDAPDSLYVAWPDHGDELVRLRNGTTIELGVQDLCLDGSELLMPCRRGIDLRFEGDAETAEPVILQVVLVGADADLQRMPEEVRPTVTITWEPGG